METITLGQGITLSIAVVGAVLGLINTWHGLDMSRVKLKVRPAHAIPVGAANPALTFCIEITNRSALLSPTRPGFNHSNTVPSVPPSARVFRVPTPMLTALEGDT